MASSSSPSTKLNIRQPGASSPDQWKCFNCTSVSQYNPQSSLVCDACGALPVVWSCGKCHHLNESPSRSTVVMMRIRPVDLKCDQCQHGYDDINDNTGASTAPAVSSKIATANQWMCAECDYKNDIDAYTCYVCHAINPHRYRVPGTDLPPISSVSIVAPNVEIGSRSSAAAGAAAAAKTNAKKNNTPAYVPPAKITLATWDQVERPQRNYQLDNANDDWDDDSDKKSSSSSAAAAMAAAAAAKKMHAPSSSATSSSSSASSSAKPYNAPTKSVTTTSRANPSSSVSGGISRPVTRVEVLPRDILTMLVYYLQPRDLSRLIITRRSIRDLLSTPAFDYLLYAHLLIPETANEAYGVQEPLKHEYITNRSEVRAIHGRDARDIPQHISTRTWREMWHWQAITTAPCYVCDTPNCSLSTGAKIGHAPTTVASTRAYSSHCMTHTVDAGYVLFRSRLLRRRYEEQLEIQRLARFRIQPLLYGGTT